MLENDRPSEADLRAAREVAIEVWSESFSRLRMATQHECVIMDEAHDLAQFAADADTRTATILLVSFLEDALQKTFADHWRINSQRETDRYFGGAGPLSTFSQRAMVARGLGWLSSDQVSELNILRRIRNTFAHNHRVHTLNDPSLAGLVTSLPKRDEIWCRGDGYRAAYEAADIEVRYRLRVFCAGLFSVSSFLVNAKTQRAQIPLGFRPESGWDKMMEVEQAMIDAAIRFCWVTLGLSYTGVVYEYRQKKHATTS